MREAKVMRNTNETEVEIKFNLDGSRKININTGIPFLDHMLTLFAFHGGFDLEIKCSGDLEIDCHHTVEDIGLTLGKTLKKAIGNKVGIKRYSHIYLPMDESLCRVVLDISNRPYLSYQVPLTKERLGTLDTETIEEFFKSFMNEAGLTLHITLLYGKNDHHKVESVFKAFGRVLKDATTITSNSITSSKGVL